jgi:4-amino-4-deoxychorismate lyase
MENYPLLESIRLENGRFALLDWHERRMQRSLLQLYGIGLSIKLSEWLQQFEVPQKGLYKCRVLYGQKLKTPEFIPYIKKPISSLQLVDGEHLDYPLKYSDRNEIGKLFASRNACDDILIVKNGCMTDTSYCNIAFKQNNDWFTPENPLLEGVQRAFLLQQGILKTARITQKDLHQFSHFKLFNAMIGWEESILLSIQNIVN